MDTKWDLMQEGNPAKKKLLSFSLSHSHTHTQLIRIIMDHNTNYPCPAVKSNIRFFRPSLNVGWHNNSAQNRRLCVQMNVSSICFKITSTNITIRIPPN